VGGLEFRRDLFRGTAGYYDRFRAPYPQALIDDLAGRPGPGPGPGAGPGGAGRLLDLACGTGQLSFALLRRFAEVWAADQEPDMISVVRAKAQAAGIGNIRTLISAAEDLAAPEESFDLVTIGNAFHRLRREAVAASVYRWLRPGRFLALVWGGSPWDGQEPWQRALLATRERWMTRAQAHTRIPAGYARARKQRPDLEILRERLKPTGQPGSARGRITPGRRLVASCEFMSESPPDLHMLNVVVADMSASLDFYRRLGVAVPGDGDAADVHVQLRMPGGLSLELDTPESARWWHAGWRADPASVGVVIGFALPTRPAVDERYAELTSAGYQGRQPPFDAFWGARYAIVADPDGNDVGLMSPLDQARRTWPPHESPAP
jgi:SAM-dependent methyltransferase/catechol 2,3-dioxygenase-like lactoylglutathione lyase family enzyme